MRKELKRQRAKQPFKQKRKDKQSPAQVLRHQTLFVVPRAKTITPTTTRYMTPSLKSKFAHKNIDTVKTKLLSCKHKNGSAYANNKRKSEHANTKMHKMSKHNGKNNNYTKLKHLRRNMPSEIQA